MYALLGRIVLGRILLRYQKDLGALGHRLFKGLYGPLPANHQGRNHIREDHDVPQGHHRIGNFLLRIKFSHNVSATVMG